MNRLLSILVTLFILFLVYLWINHLTGKSDKNDELEIPESELNFNNESEPEEILDLSNEITDEGDDDESPAPSEPEKKAAEPEPVKQPEEKPKPRATSPPTKETTSSPKQTIEASGMHLVIAGNFLTRANAEERVRELHKLGYPNAEVVNFELSEYHTACAGRYKDLNEARRVSKKIKEAHGIDTYVRLGN